MPTLSRRAVIAAATGLPLTASPAIARMPDPIFAVIDWHRRARDAINTCEIDNEVIQNEHIVSFGALFKTEPTTVAGCQALAEFVIGMAEEDYPTAGERTLEVLSLALERLAAVRV
jgi:hypothetical protein